MNRTIIKGNLTANPKEFTAQNEQQTKLAKFAVAVRRSYQPDKADFFHCTAFGKRALFILDNFKKGRPILIAGHMENDNFRNRDDEQVYGYNLIVDEVEFADTKPKSGGDPETATGASDNSDSDIDEGSADQTSHGTCTDDENFNFLSDVMPYDWD